MVERWSCFNVMNGLRSECLVTRRRSAPDVFRAVLLVVAALCSPAHAASDAAFVRTLYLVRHGSYLPDPKVNPELGPSLTALGIAQARLVGSRLQRNAGDLRFDHVEHDDACA